MEIIKDKAITATSYLKGLLGKYSCQNEGEGRGRIVFTGWESQREEKKQP